ncbi:LLM class flavin-dependent oxidoreductase [Streptomyces griseorubiginosus]|uniref:LLM class flavin-dependent oxidoreductase n=1 Tax=Streptomyces griseorubiginosus TaxID=67304 RepID=UPI001AD621F0|nr:LLM class flavin-dependent oxidoreductase [Streptomyces griseorubiginosus]MBO4256364.1 LLM class flavin-dependent oxidoreductase [Streptomyces griseorubiginosus]
MKFGLFHNPMVIKGAGKEDWEPEQERQKFNELLEQIELADRLGFDYVFLGEHHFTAEYAHNSAPEVILGALSRSTSKIRLGTGIVHASHNDPVRTAERISTLDVLSGGRMEFGFGAGGPAEVAPFLGELAGRRSERSVASSQISVDILASRGAYPGVQNEFFQLPPVNVIPKPLQSPHPPLWTSTTNANQVPGIAKRGLGCLMLSAAGIDDVEHAVDGYWDALLSPETTPMGQGVNPGLFVFGCGIIAPSAAEAQKRARRGMELFSYGLTGAHAAIIANPEANLTDLFEAHQRGEGDVRETLGMPEGFRLFGDAWPDLPGNVMCSPSEALDTVSALADVHADGFLLNQQFGDTSHEHLMESIELFANEVIAPMRERDREQKEWRAKKLANLSHPIVSSL